MTHPNAQPVLQFVWLEVADLARSKTFYGETLALPVTESGGGFLVVDLGKSSLYLAAGQPRLTSMYLAIAVPDIDPLHQHLLEQGVAAPSPVDEGWARYIELTDPDGYRLLLLTPAASS